MKKQNKKSDKISLFKGNLQFPLKTDSDSENVIVTLSGDESDNNLNTEELDVVEGFDGRCRELSC